VSVGAPGGFVMMVPKGVGPGTWGAWGEEETAAQTAASGGSSQLATTIQELLPLVPQIIEATTDPYQRYEVLMARAKQLRAMGLEGRAQILEARARGAARKIGLRTEAEESTREWRSLGKTGVSIGIGVGGALMVLLLVMAFRR